jgi:hypothetical protein
MTWLTNPMYAFHLYARNVCSVWNLLPLAALSIVALFKLCVLGGQQRVHRVKAHLWFKMARLLIADNTV